jgi:hypothetical protein
MPGPTRYQHRRMHALWRSAGLQGTDRRRDRIRLTGRFVDRPELTTSDELTEAQADQLIDYMAGLDREGRLATVVATWLVQNPA